MVSISEDEYSQLINVAGSKKRTTKTKCITFKCYGTGNREDLHHKFSSGKYNRTLTVLSNTDQNLEVCLLGFS